MCFKVYSFGFMVVLYWSLMFIWDHVIEERRKGVCSYYRSHCIEKGTVAFP